VVGRKLGACGDVIRLGWLSTPVFEPHLVGEAPETVQVHREAARSALRVAKLGRKTRRAVA
jgi:hypothetical protein